MPEFTELIDLASERVGGLVLSANDDFFAEKENLLKAGPAVFIEGKYTDRGKWMDGWETRRRRQAGYDWCLVRLGLPGVIRGVVVDTAYFKGNYPERCSLEACVAPGSATPEQLEGPETEWTTILPESPLVGDAKNLFEIRAEQRFTHLRLNIFPDGGVARLRVHGEVRLDWRGADPNEVEVDLGAAVNGGRVVAASDMFFGSRHHLGLPGPGLNMGDGWETKRRRGPGHDWVVVQLAASGFVRRIEVDTSHFKGNAPGWCDLEALAAPDEPLEAVLEPGRAWQPLLPRTELAPHRVHLFEDTVLPVNESTHVRFNIYPDGGVSRLRLFGRVGPLGARWLTRMRLNCRSESECVRELLACCGSLTWARGLATRRPFGSTADLLAKADESFLPLEADEWRATFASHPRIGKLNEADEARALDWSRQEQAGSLGSPPETLAALATWNERYEEKFGFRYIVFASGKTAAEMLDDLKQRMNNDPDQELRTAEQELRKITQLRLEKLLDS